MRPVAFQVRSWDASCVLWFVVLPSRKNSGRVCVGMRTDMFALQPPKLNFVYNAAQCENPKTGRHGNAVMIQALRVSGREPVPFFGDETGSLPLALSPLAMGHLLAAVVSLLLVAAGCEKATVRTLDGENGTARSAGNVGNTPAHAAGAPRLTTTSQIAAAPRVYDETSDSPRDDGWDTEAYARIADGHLKQLGKWLRNREGQQRDTKPTWLHGGFRCRWLRPPEVHQVYDDGSITVYRGASDALAEAELMGDSAGNAAHDKRGYTSSTPNRPVPVVALAEVVLQWRSGFTSVEWTKAKIIGIRDLGSEFTTEVLFQAFGRGKSLLVQQNAKWVCRWSKVAEQANDMTTDRETVTPSEPAVSLRLSAISVTDFEEVIHSATSPLLSDVTATVFADDPGFAAQLSQSIDHWTRRLPTGFGISPWGDCGIAVGDANGDELDDIYLCQPGGLPNLLYFQRSDGTLVRATAESAVNWLDDSRSALFLDLDNDGDQDLVIGSREFLLLMENDGSGRFRLRADFREGRDAFSMAAADYDQDGNLDIYVCRYYADNQTSDGDSETFQTGRARFSAPIPYHNATNGPANLLLRNKGNWQFSLANEETALREGNHRWSYAAAWEDFDNDGDQDLYVANDFGPNNLYRNDDGRFIDVAESANATDASTGMSADWSDYDRDGLMDVYVGNMFSSAGHRVMSQHRFKPGANAEMVARYKHLARGNSLLKNNGDGRFEDVTLQAQVHMGRWAWSSNFVDINNDGWQDLAIANGYYSGENHDDL